jgi:protein-tyrosine phosphatase
MQSLLYNAAEVGAHWKIDSAGITGVHTGEPADSRMQTHASRRGFELASIARGVSFPDDFKAFDYLIAMDQKNLRDLYELDSDSLYRDKIYLFSHFFRTYERSEVPDPYFGGAEGFELVLDMVEDGCTELLSQMKMGELK